MSPIAVTDDAQSKFMKDLSLKYSSIIGRPKPNSFIKMQELKRPINRILNQSVHIPKTKQNPLRFSYASPEQREQPRI